MKKLIATISIITALGVGAFALNSVLPAGAVGSAANQTNDPSSACGGPRAKFKGVLDKLVTDGTITQAQEDAIIQAMKDEVAGSQPSNAGPRGGGARLRVLEGMLQVSADTIHVSVDDLKAALKSGQSVADVANAHSVNPSDVITAIVNAGTTKIDQAVTDGKLTQERADKLKSKLPELADKFVNHTKPAC
ncbi:MAG: hypothetical protein QOG30_237 [Acidimicrobiaceae bacterium]|jgi:polyhydroxyalkanoate synthesis regulator phasin